MAQRFVSLLAGRLWTRREGPLAGFAGGVAAGGAFLAVELGARVAWDVPTLPELVQDRLVQALPGPMFAFMLEHLLYLGKPALFSALLCLQLLLAGLAGIAVGRIRRPIESALILWLGTGLGLLPFVEQGAFGGRASIALTLLAAYGAFALTLALLWRPGAPAGFSRRNAAVRFARRDLLAGTGLLALSALFARLAIGNLPRVPSRRGRLPEPITPAGDFYVVSKNLLDPEVDAAGWQLDVAGLVDRPFTLTYAEILAMPAQHVVRTLECISNEVGGELISNGQWTGVRMADVLERAGVQAGARLLHFTSTDAYTENMAIEKGMDPETLLAYELNGQPLPKKHGFPLRVLGTGTYGMKNPKWLRRIEVAATAADGFWENQGWTPDAVVQTMSRIDVPPAGVVPARAPINVQGIAFAGDRGIRTVELSADGGSTWAATALAPALGPYTWVFWTTSITAEPGSFVLAVRATDGAGQPQEPRDTDTYPAGATGYHRVHVVAG